MSFCPNKDVHSIYLDNEMPEIYVAEYEAHLKNCPKCQAELNKLKRVHTLLREDSASIEFSQEKMDDSFKRLEMKLSYSKNTGRSRNRVYENVRTFVPLAAAAAILAVVLPFNLHRVNNTTIPAAEQMPQIAQQQSESNVQGASQAVATNASNVAFGNYITTTETPVISVDNHKVLIPLTKTTQISSGITPVNSGNVDKKLIKDVGLFRPEFTEDKTVSIKISVPGINMNPVTTEIELPINILAGLFE